MSSDNYVRAAFTDNDTLEQRIQKSRSLNIVLVSIPNMGHLSSIGHIGEAMKERGHNITVISMDNAKGREMCPKMFDRMGIPYKLTPAISHEDVTKFEYYLAPWKDGCLEAIKEINPDLIVCDVLSASIGADQLGIPFVINVSIPISMFLEVDWIKAIDSDKAKNCCGCICYFGSVMSCITNLFFALRPERVIMKRARHTQNNNLVILNTFWGLEKPQSLPPNFVVTGPLFTPSDSLLPQLIEKDKALYDWLEAAHAAKEDVIYVSIGTEVQWKQWSVDTIYAGLKQIGCKVVWSIR